MAKKTTSRKKVAAKKFAPLGLLLSGLALLAGIIILAIKLLTIMQIYVPADGQWINTALLISFGLFIIGFALFALLDPKRVREFITGRQAKHGSNALITLVALVGILIVVNLIVFQNPVQWDWTADKTHTLAPETLATLKALPSPVTALCFFTTNYSSASSLELLDDIKNSSDGKFNYQIINPESDPALAQQYGVSRDGTIVLVLNDQQELLTYASEQGFTSAMVRLMNPGERVVYFLIGHGESSISTSSETSYTRAVSVLESKNYAVNTLNLRAQNEIPADAKAIIIAGATQPISADEIALLRSYVDGGGALIVLEQCTLETDLGNSPDPLQNYLSGNWGVVFNNDIVIDPSTNSPTIAVSYTYGDHAITTNLQQTIAFFPISRSITLSAADAAILQTPLIYTYDSAWGETDFNNQQTTYQPGVDNPGPVLLAAALENSTSGSRLVVIGDASFGTDTFFDQYANADLFINSVDWAAGEQDMINLTTTTTTERSLMPIKNVGWIMLGLSFICIIPGIIVAGGIISWITRRARG